MHSLRSSLLRPLRWGSLLLVLLATASCQPATQFTLSPCSLSPSTLQTLQTSDTWLGCLVAFWKRQDVSEALFRPVVLAKDGTLTLRASSASPQDTSFRLSLPRSAINDPSGLLLRIYIASQAKSKALSSAPFEEHQTFCREMSSPLYDCFSPTRTETCWLSLNVQPQTSSEDIKVFSLGLPNNETCRVCEREICGDGKDNNCNGLIDEFDEIGGQRAPCSSSSETLPDAP